MLANIDITRLAPIKVKLFARNESEPLIKLIIFKDRTLLFLDDESRVHDSGYGSWRIPESGKVGVLKWTIWVSLDSYNKVIHYGLGEPRVGTSMIEFDFHNKDRHL